MEFVPRILDLARAALPGCAGVRSRQEVEPPGLCGLHVPERRLGPQRGLPLGPA